jgi:hypothetical protein
LLWCMPNSKESIIARRLMPGVVIVVVLKL